MTKTRSGAGGESPDVEDDFSEEITDDTPAIVANLSVMDPALEGQVPETNVDVVIESPAFQAALAREVARVLRQRENEAKVDAPYGTVDIALRAGLPMSDQPYSQTQRARANPPIVRMSSAYPSEEIERSSIRKINPIINEGGNPGKNFSNPLNIDGYPTSNNQYPQQRRDSDAWTSSDNRTNSWNSSKNTSAFQQQQSSQYTQPQQRREDPNKPSYRPPQAFEYESEESYNLRTPKLRHRLVSQTLYIKVAQVFITECEKNKIDMNTPDKFRRLRLLHATLANADLLTLLTGHRPQPTTERDVNRYGYSDSRVINIPLLTQHDEESSSVFTRRNATQYEEVMLKEDDVFKYKYDNERLYSLVYAMFHPNLHHHVTIQSESTRNGINAYHDIHQYVFGQKQIDIKHAKKALDSHKVNVHSPMRTEYSKWETVFSNLEYAQNRQMTEVEKISWLSDQFNNDPRSQIQSCFVASAANNESYSLMVEKLLRTADLISDTNFRVATFETSNMTSSSSDPTTLFQNTVMNAG